MTQAPGTSEGLLPEAAFGLDDAPERARIRSALLSLTPLQAPERAAVDRAGDAGPRPAPPALPAEGQTQVELVAAEVPDLLGRFSLASNRPDEAAGARAFLTRWFEPSNLTGQADGVQVLYSRPGWALLATKAGAGAELARRLEERFFLETARGAVLATASATCGLGDLLGLTEPLSLPLPGPLHLRGVTIPGAGSIPRLQPIVARLAAGLDQRRAELSGPRRDRLPGWVRPCRSCQAAPAVASSAHATASDDEALCPLCARKRAWASSSDGGSFTPVGPWLGLLRVAWPRPARWLDAQSDAASWCAALRVWADLPELVFDRAVAALGLSDRVSRPAASGGEAVLSGSAVDCLAVLESLAGLLARDGANGRVLDDRQTRLIVSLVLAPKDLGIARMGAHAVAIEGATRRGLEAGRSAGAAAVQFAVLTDGSLVPEAASWRPPSPGRLGNGALLQATRPWALDEFAGRWLPAIRLLASSRRDPEVRALEQAAEAALGESGVDEAQLTFLWRLSHDPAARRAATRLSALLGSENSEDLLAQETPSGAVFSPLLEAWELARCLLDGEAHG